MEGEDWQADGGAVLGMYLNGDSIPGTDPTGNRVVDDHFLLWFNAGAEGVSATLPSAEYAEAWDVVIDTGDSVGEDRPHAAGDVVQLAGRSVVVLRQHTAPEVEVDHSVAASIKAQSTNGDADSGSSPSGRRPVPRPRTVLTRMVPEPAGDRMSAVRIPASTYRLQITEDFDLLEAARTLAYLHDLGVDWVYLSPVLAAESGSDHGYDVSDHSAIDASRGRGAGLAALSSEARRLGMGVLVDIVPNHVGIARPWENAWWWHVLTHGQESPYADAFDIDWEAGGGRVLIPVVGDDDLGDDGRIGHLRVLAGELHYHDQRFPLAPGTADAEAADDPDAVHARQHYELVHWRRGDSELNYRRFFSVNTLAAIRVEEAEWFERSHEEIARWFADELVDGLRIDHPDGLRDPAKYLDDLAELTGGAYVLVEKILEPGERLPDSWATAGTTGYDALALVDRVLTDPAGEAAARGARGPAARRPRRLAGDDPRHQARTSPRSRCWPRPGGSPASCGRCWRNRRSRTSWSTRSPSCWPASPSTAPTCPRVATTSTRRSRSPGSTGPTWPASFDAVAPVLGDGVGRRRPSGSSRPAAW